MNAPAYTVARDRWSQTSIFEQMGNIYSEVGRSINAKRLGDNQSCEFAVIRALDLFDATVENLVKHGSVRSKEVLRAKDQFLHAIYDKDSTPGQLADIDRYFMQFAIAARLNR